jgi:hypothetical protein
MSDIDDLEISIDLRVGLFEDHWTDVVAHWTTVYSREEIIDDYFDILSTLKQIDLETLFFLSVFFEKRNAISQNLWQMSNTSQSGDEIAVA